MMVPRRFGLVLTALIAGVAMVLVAAPADAGPTERCYEMVDLNVVEVPCEYSAQSIQHAQASEPGSTWVVYQLARTAPQASQKLVRILVCAPWVA